jgi:putative flippase GtrA
MAAVSSIRAFLDRNRLVKQFVKFCMVGGLSALINFVIYEGAISGFGMWYIWAAVWAYGLSAVLNFLLNKFWTFRNPERGRTAVGQLMKFTTVIATGLGLNVLLIYALTDMVGLHYRLSWVGATGVVTFWNFAMNRLWTFRAHKLPEEQF